MPGFLKTQKIWIAGLILLGILSGFYFYPQIRQNQEAALQRMRDDVYRDLKLELEDVVRAQVKEEVAIVLAQYPDAQNAFVLSQLNPQTHGSTRGDIKQIVRVAVEDIFRERQAAAVTALDFEVEKEGGEYLSILPEGIYYVTDEQLARFVASGGVKTEIPVSENAMKAVESGEAGAVASNLDSDVAGLSERTPESLERTLQQKGSILLPKGSWQVEPSVTLAHVSSSQVTINGISFLDIFTIGSLFTSKIKRDILIQNLSLKYGLLNNFQVEFKIPTRFHHERIARISPSSVVSEDTRSKYGLGDIEFGASRQVAWEHGLIPDLVAGLTIRTPTGQEPYNNSVGLGTGHWGVKTSLVAAKASDPMVVFGSLNYTVNLPRNGIDNVGDIDPGDTFGWSLGTAIALSYKTAINFSFDQSFTGETIRNDSAVAGSFLQAANFKSGLSWAIDESKSLDFSVGIGLSNDAPDMTLEVRVPIKF